MKAEGGEVLERALRAFLPEERGEYDDLVTAIACPIWFQRAKMGNVVREPLPPREVVEPYRPPTFDQVFKGHQKRVETRKRI